MDWLRVRRRIEYVAFRLVVCLIDMLSPQAAARFAKVFAWFVHRVLSRKLTRYAVARENLRIAFGTQLSDAAADDMIHRMWQHLFRLVVETVQAPRRMHMYSYRQLIHFSAHRPTVEALLSGRPVLLLAGHYGNWEVATSIFGLWGMPMGLVAREMDNPYLHNWFARSREHVGHRLLIKKGNFDDMLGLLQRGGNLGLLCDQDAGPRGLFVNFFGTPASAFKSIALMAQEYNALMMVGFALRKPDLPGQYHPCFEVGCEAVIDPLQLTTDDPIREITEGYTAALERAIRRAPEQYFWVHRRWKSQPKAKVKTKPSAAA